MFTVTEHYISLAQFAYILSSIFFAAVRWFHMCHPYDKTPHYYYPGRVAAIFVMLSTLLLIPFAVNPSSTDAWSLAKAFYLILLPFFIALLLYKYFGTVKQWYKWRRETLVLGVLFLLTVLGLFAVAVVPNDQILPKAKPIINYVIIAESILSLVFCLWAMLKIYSWIRQYADENYSNEDDFPEHFARKLLLFALVLVFITFVVVQTESKVGAALIGLLMTISNVVLLILVLHPHRTSQMETEADDGTPEDTGEQQLAGSAPSKSTIDAIIKTIHENVEDRNLYLNPHLSMQDVVDQCGFGRTYVSWVFKNKLGGFFFYVNRLRLNYAAEYKRQHPMATLDEVASASGFSTRQSYYRVRKRLEE
ncbi:MAG: helix-turn-helix transcriptional regulator [Prevotella sp.]|nr:helix-turn-helix transcriptional regulator [Prevotella sp.]